MTRTLLVKNIHTLVTMDDEQREIRNASIFAEGPAITPMKSSISRADSSCYRAWSIRITISIRR